MPRRILDLFTRFKWYLLVILISIPTVSSLLRPGYFPMHDDLQAMRVYQMELCLRDFQIPCRWVPDMGYQYGYPQYEYYGPLPYYLMTLPRFLGLSIFGSVKLGFILALVLGNLAMFLLASSLFGVWGGLLSAIAYSYAPFRASDLFSRGAMGESWAFVFLPLILYAIIRLFRRPGIKSAALLGLSSAALFITHNVSTLMFAPLFGLLALVLLFQSKDRISFAKFGVLGLVWGILAAGFFFLPVIFEGGYAHTESLISGYFNYLAHFISLKQLLLYTHWGYSSSEIGPTDDLAFFIGPIQLFLFAISVVFAALTLKKKKTGLPATLTLISAGLFLLSLFMTHEKSTFIWKAIPVFSYLQFPWRFLVPVTFFVSLAAGYFVSTLRQKTVFLFVAFFSGLIVFFNVSYFRPREWFDLTIWEKFSGHSWDKQLTISIFDYLPIYAKFPPAYPAPSYPYAEEGVVSVLDYNHRTDKITFATRSEENTKLILPQFDFPGWRVRLDGKVIPHGHDNNLGLISFDLPAKSVGLPAGEHRVEAKLEDTLVRFAGSAATLVAAPLALYFLLKKND